jgi:hypothetical protein
VDSVSVRIGASREEFAAGMAEARQRFDAQLRGQQAHLGVFRDEDVQRVDIDPVLVVNNHRDVETIGAYSHSVGGAYRFEDGLGYWPPHVAEPSARRAAMTKKSKDYPGGIAQWRREATKAQGTGGHSPAPAPKKPTGKTPPKSKS